MRKRWRVAVAAVLAGIGAGIGVVPSQAGEICVGTACQPQPVALAPTLQAGLRAAVDALGSSGPVCSATGTYDLPISGTPYALMVCVPDSGEFTAPANGTFADTRTGINDTGTQDFTGLVTRSGDYSYPPNFTCEDAGIWVETPPPIDPDPANRYDSQLSVTAWNCVAP